MNRQHVGVNFRERSSNGNLVRVRFFGHKAELQQNNNGSFSVLDDDTSASTSEDVWYNVLIVATNNKVDVFRGLDGSPMVKILEDDSAIRIASSDVLQVIATGSANVDFDDIAVNPELPFVDDFNDAVIGPWTTTGTWTEANGYLEGQAGVSTATAVMPLALDESDEQQFRARYRWPAGANFTRAGFTIRHDTNTNPNDFVRVIFESGKAEIIQFIGGNTTTLDTNGGSLTQLFPNSNYPTNQIELIESSNKLQLVASPNVGVRFDDIRVNAPNLDIFAHLDTGTSSSNDSPCIEAGYPELESQDPLPPFRDFFDQQGPLDYDGDEHSAPDIGADEAPQFSLPTWLKLVQGRL